MTFTGVGGGVTVSSNTGQRVDISVAAQSVQTQGVSALAASNTTYSSGLAVLTGSNMVTVKSSGAGQTIVIDATQSVQVVQSAIAASNTTYSSGLVVFTGSNQITVKSSGAGQTVVIDMTQSVQVVQSAIAASNTTYTSGLVTITGVGGGVTVSSNTGQRIDISVAAPVAQTVQTQNVVDVTLSGNTSGALALVSSGTLTLAGGNNITLSQAGNAITISGAAAAGAQTGISSIAASNTTYTSGGVTITGSNMVTVRSTTGQGIVIDATQSVQVVQSAIAATNTTYTSGLVVLTGSNAATVKSSAAGQTVIIDVPTQTVQTQNVVDVTLSGNTSGAMALISSGTLTLAGGNNITLSQAGNAVTISGAAAGGAQTAISGIVASNATYTSGTVTFTGSNMVTVKSTTGQQVIIDATQSVQTQNMVAVSATNTLYSSGTVLFTGSNMITVKSSGAGQTIILDATQSVQTQGQMSLGVSNLGNTQGNTGVSGTRIVLVGTNGVTLSQDTNANGATISFSAAGAGGGNFSGGASNLGNTAGSTGITGTQLVLVGTNMISLSQSTGANGGTLSIAATQSVQTQSIISGIAASNTTFTSGSVIFSGTGGGVTVGSGVQRVNISVAPAFSAGVSSDGATLGQTGLTFPALQFVGSNAITLTQGTNANGGTIGFIVDNPFSAGVSTGGNTQGNTTVRSGRLILVGSNNVSLSQATDIAGQTVTINVTAGGGVNIAASNTTYTSGTVVFSASDSLRSAISIASVGAQSVIVSDAGPQLAYWNRGWPNAPANSGMLYGTAMTVFPMVPHGGNRFDGRMTASIFRLMASMDQSSSASISAALSSTMNLFIYTRTSDSLSLINSGSMSFGNSAASSNNSRGWTGNRVLEITATSKWSSRPDFLYGGEYYVGVRMDTHITTGLNKATWINVNIGSQLVLAPNYFSSTATGNSMRWRPFQGVFALSATNAIRTTIAMSEISGIIPASIQNFNVDPYLQMFETTFLAALS